MAIKNFVYLHEFQNQVYKAKSRFKVVVAGRRWGKCLAGDTLIEMADGSQKKICDIKVGDSVLTVNEETLRIEPKSVAAMQSNGVRETFCIRTKTRSIVCTPHHPFMVSFKWMTASEIKSGDFLVVRDGNRLSFDKVLSVESHESVETWDLQIDGNHNFFANGAVSHNTQLSKAMIVKYAKVQRRLIWYVAPSFRMAKDIMWPELKYSLPRKWIKRINETSLEMTLINDTRIALRGADNPDSLRGVGIHFLVMDEVQDINPEAWTKVLRPTLASTGGHALFIGCVSGHTKVLKRDGITDIESLSKTKEPKTLERIDLDLYGIDKSFHKADGYWNNGVVDTKKITTHNGFSLEASYPHPILVMGKDGVPTWKRSEEITTDDYVAIGMGMEQWGNKDPLKGFDEHISSWRKEEHKNKKSGPRSKGLIQCE